MFLTDPKNISKGETFIIVKHCGKLFVQVRTKVKLL